MLHHRLGVGKWRQTGVVSKKAVGARIRERMRSSWMTRAELHQVGIPQSAKVSDRHAGTVACLPIRLHF